MKFEEWLKKVDKALAGRTYGAISSHLDLADMPYRDWFEDGMSPEEAADEVLEEEGFPEL